MLAIVLSCSEHNSARIRWNQWGEQRCPIRMSIPTINRYIYLSPLRVCLILKVFALSRHGLTRLRRAKVLLCFVENARSAFSTKHNKTSECRRREQAIVMEIRHSLRHATKG